MNLKSGYPFFLINSGLPFAYPRLEKSLKTEVAIIGGGISGALMGYYLTKAGISCIIIDSRTIGLGSTCASTSLLQYEIDTPLSELKDKVGLRNAVLSYKLCERAIYELGKISTALNFKQFEFKESLYYAAEPNDKKFLKTEFDIRKKSGFEVSYLTDKEIKKRFGFRASSAILSKSGAQTNAYDFTHALLQHAQKNGMKIFDKTSIINIKHLKDSVTLKSDTGCVIKAKKLIYANGFEAINYIEKKIVDLQSTYATISEQFNSSTKFWENESLIWNTADPYLYIRTTPDRRILIGGRDVDYYDIKKRDKLINKKTNLLVKDFNNLFPHVEFKPEFSWTGTFGSTKDGLPYIGSYKKLANSFFALGFGGNGITFSLLAAEIITAIITDRPNKYENIFSFERT
jgi:glycine/D-amino acid oxidase-like deaminating enzyme